MEVCAERGLKKKKKPPFYSWKFTTGFKPHCFIFLCMELQKGVHTQGHCSKYRQPINIAKNNSYEDKKNYGIIATISCFG